MRRPRKRKRSGRLTCRRTKFCQLSWERKPFPYSWMRRILGSRISRWWLSVGELAWFQTWILSYRDLQEEGKRSGREYKSNDPDGCLKIWKKFYFSSGLTIGGTNWCTDRASMQKLPSLPSLDTSCWGISCICTSLKRTGHTYSNFSSLRGTECSSQHLTRWYFSPFQSHIHDLLASR